MNNINNKNNNTNPVPVPNKNLNFSVYIESKDNTPPNIEFLENKINTIYPKINSEWVDSDKVINCQLCSNSFSFFNRKHHCRACGGVYCGSCCYNYIKIPYHIFDIPKEKQLWSVYFKKLVVGSNKDLVCNECFSKIKNLIDIENLINICTFLSIKDLYSLLCLNRKWHNASIHCLSKFRNIQYKSPDYVYNENECNMIIGNSEYLCGHNSWINILIKSFIIKKNKNIIHLLNNYKKTVLCWNVMCSRKCNILIDMLNIIDIIEFISKILIDIDESIYEIINTLFKIRNKKIDKLGIPFLINSLRNHKDKEFIKNIIELFFKDNDMIILLAFEYNYLKTMKSMKPKNNSIELIEIINFLNNKLDKTYKELLNNSIIFYSQLYDERSIKNDIKFPLIYPFNTNFFIVSIEDIKEIQSFSKPLLVTVKVKDKDNKKSIKKFILKKDLKLRKENIVSNLIIILQEKLLQQMERGRIDYFDPIPTYKILMVNNDIAIIEYLEDCLTLKNISLKNYTLQNYILENNKEDKIYIVKERFSKSLAISSCLSFILGLGDRHSGNIMISKNGQIFHIDYGYILENPIHYSIFNNPIIRISDEMIDFLGGSNSNHYNLFKEYIIKVFDLLRLYSDVIISHYLLLENENIFNTSSFKNKLLERFLNGMSIKDIEVVLTDVIETSSKSYAGTFVDLCNEYSNKIKSFI